MAKSTARRSGTAPAQPSRRVPRGGRFRTGPFSLYDSAMATKTGRPRPGGPGPGGKTGTKSDSKPGSKSGGRPSSKPSSKSVSKSGGGNSGGAAADGAQNPGSSFLKSTLLPSAGCGVLLALVAVQEGADLAVGVLMAVCMTGVIVGMIKLKKAMYGG